MHKALRQAALALVTLSAAALVLSTGVVGSTVAIFNGETQNATSTFAGGWVDAPGAFTATASGYDVALGWTPGTHGPVTGQQLNGVNNGTNASCTGAGYLGVSTLSSSAATYTDSNRGSTINGNWFCYQLISTSATIWTAQATQALQVGLVTTSIAIANVGTNNSVNAGDTITLTFNQKTNFPASGATKICVRTVGKIILGDTTGGASCADADAYNIGVITGVAIGTARTYGSSSYTTSTVAPWTMTITVGGSNTSTYSGTGAFTPSVSILSAATTHQATMCIAASATCQPTTVTHF